MRAGEKILEDRLLILKFKCGSSEALCRIYEKYRGTLLKVAMALLNDVTAAEDIVHDCFVSFAQSPEKVNSGGNLKSYLGVCVANRVRNSNLAATRKKAGRLDENASIVSRAARPEEWIISNERLNRLNGALAELPSEQREVVSLHLQGEMKFKTIAEVQEVSVNTVQSRYRYGMDKLRTLLNGEGLL